MTNNTAILFDLDGTLLDTVRDFAGAINLMRTKRQLSEIPLAAFRQHAYGESNLMVSFAFDIDQAAPQFPELKQEFLETYAKNITQHTCFFPGITDLLDTLDKKEISWGIVTNKPGWLMAPLAEFFQFTKRAKCIVSGDTLPTKKPDPAPLTYGCELAGFSTKNTWYVGDSESDMIAAHSAGMKSIAVTYGYHKPGTVFNDWQPDVIANDADDICAALQVN